MVAHNNEVLKKVLLDTKVKAVIPLARHIIKLESMKDFANSLDDYISDISSMADKNKDLVAAIRH
ncbi:MAG: hypothetical protein IJT37_05725 [Lachnospiraceae bacterium]|nr:hypothetical protein [Lachnospiraceae bacterium]